MTTLADAIYEQFKRDHPYGKNTLLCDSCRRRKDHKDFRETPWHGRAARCLECEGGTWRRGFEEQTHWELVQAREKLRMWQRYASHLRSARFRDPETLRIVTAAGTVIREVRLWQ